MIGNRAAFAVRYIVANLLGALVAAAIVFLVFGEGGKPAAILNDVAGVALLYFFPNLMIFNAPFVALASQLARLGKPYSYVSVILCGWVYCFAVFMTLQWWFHKPAYSEEWQTGFLSGAFYSALGGLFLAALYYGIVRRHRVRNLFEQASEV